MYKEIIDNYERCKAKVSELANFFSSATNVDEKKKCQVELEKAQKEVENLYAQIKGVEVESEFTLGQIIQGDDKTRITICVSPTDKTMFPAFNESGEEITTTHFGVSSRWFLALTSGICPVSNLILSQVPDIKRTLKATLFSIYTGAKIKLVRKLALKGEKRKIGEDIYNTNQFVLDKVVSLNINIDVKDKFDELRFEMWKAQLASPYNETQQQNTISSLFKLS